MRKTCCHAGSGREGGDAVTLWASYPEGLDEHCPLGT
jgi:hypothetical protein